MVRNGLQLLRSTAIILVIGAAFGHAWETGNTNAVPHPDTPLGGGSSIPTILSTVQRLLTEPCSKRDNLRGRAGCVDRTYMFLGPLAAHPWLVRNHSHRWTILDIVAASVGRMYVALTTTGGDRAELPWKVQLVGRSSWELCYAKQPLEGGIELDGRCTAFKTRQGSVALGVGSVHNIALEMFSLLGGVQRVDMSFMEESLQIFHPSEVQGRAALLELLVNDLVDEMITSNAADLSWNPRDATQRLSKLFGDMADDGPSSASALLHGFRGLSLLSYETFRAHPTSFNTPKSHPHASGLGPTVDDEAGTCGMSGGSAAPGGGECEESSKVTTTVNGATPIAQFQVGVVSQNIWNFNGDWAKRRSALSNDVSLGVPFPVDVITLQEVRYHSNAPNLPCVGGVEHTSQHSIRSKLPNGKCQSLDMVLGIASSLAETSQNVDSFEFFPAMTYLHLSRYEAPRIEMEGLMNILVSQSALPSSNHKRLVGHARHLLWRNISDHDGDAHQRAVLCSVVLFRVSPNNEALAAVDLRVDFCTSHFALGMEAQERNTKDVLIFVEQLRHRRHIHGTNVPKASATVFTGDLNSEPHHVVATLLRGNGFSDLWEACGPQHRNSPSSPNDDGFTFNTNDEALVKRIDFIYLKLHDPLGGLTARCEQFTTLGTTSLSGGDVSSDHLGIAAQITLEVRTPTQS